MRDDFCEFIFDSSDANFYSEIIDIFENIGYFCENPYNNYKIRVSRWIDGEDDVIEFENKSEMLSRISDYDNAYFLLWNKSNDDIDIIVRIQQPYNYLQIELGLFSNEESKKIVNRIWHEITNGSLNLLLRHIVIDKTNYLAEKTVLVDDLYHLKLLENCSLYDLKCIDSHTLKHGAELVENISPDTVYIFDLNTEKNKITVNNLKWMI